jgi:hypothetical protein
MSLSLTAKSLGKYLNPVFVETGTYTGGGVMLAYGMGFKEIYSVEIFEEFQAENRKKFEGYPNIHLYTGDSETMLWDMIKDIKEKITFFLDSHVVQQTGGASGIREVPLLQELDIIKKHERNDHTIMIDDRSMMGRKQHPSGWISNRWQDIFEDQVMEKLFYINSNYKINYEATVNALDDIIVAHV